MLVFSPLLERMFVNRGYTDSFLSTYENFDGSERMKDADAFCKRLRELYLDPSHPKIVFYPDFDMDGIMSGVVGLAGLAELGFANAVLHVPNPQDGYGFDAKTIDDILVGHPDAKVLMTADNGITCFEGIEYAKSKGLEVLITDHHKQGDVLPSADIIVDPMRMDDPFTNPYICGATVIYQLLQQYADEYCDNITRAQIRRLRVFAGIGTISDAMELLHANRRLVRDAISICKLIYSNGDDYVVSAISGAPVYCSAFWGLKAVLKVFTDAGKLSSKHDIDEQFFGYYLAPMFNAVKRMDGDMARAFGVFFGTQKDDDANYLFETNELRKTTVAACLEEMVSADNPMAPFVYVTTASRGLAGLLATQLMDIAQGPCLVVRQEDDGSYGGSGRAPAWYPFLTFTAGTTVQAAGHEAAFGVHFDDKAALDAYLDFIKKDVAEKLQGVDLDSFKVQPDFIIDPSGAGDVGIDIVSFLEFLDELEHYKPFGVGFPEPNILLRFHPSDAQWSVIGSMKQHLKLRLQYGFEVLIWNSADEIERQNSNELVYLQGRLNKNSFRGSETVQFIGSFV